MNLTLIYVAAAAMLAVGIGFLLTLLRRSPTRRPQDAAEWIGASLSGLLVVFSALLLVLTYRLDVRQETMPPVAPVAGYQGTTLDEPAEDFAFQLVETDEPARLTDYQGQVVLLNFWATWCAPCLEEMPDLNRLQARYGDEGLVVLTISDEPRDDLLAFEETLPMDTERGYVADPTRLPQPFMQMITARPSTYVIDRDGRLRQYVLGARNYDFFEQAVTPHL